MWAHPRSRGENSDHWVLAFALLGSSPLTRGKQAILLFLYLTRGLIPAHAGKTEIPGFSLPSCAAHPRSRGENCLRCLEGHLRDGSSPLTRGKLGASQGPVCNSGLIPAHAGKTSPAMGAREPEGAHPRSRGENARDDAGIPWFKGSSPLTRGKLRRGRRD